MAAREMEVEISLVDDENILLEQTNREKKWV